MSSLISRDCSQRRRGGVTSGIAYLLRRLPRGWPFGVALQGRGVLLLTFHFHRSFARSARQIAQRVPSRFAASAMGVNCIRITYSNNQALLSLPDNGSLSLARCLAHEKRGPLNDTGSRASTVTRLSSRRRTEMNDLW